MSKKGNLREIASVFFRMGAVAFGGPAAHIAMMESEIITKRKWMDRQHFLDLMGATNLIPGPNSTEMTMHCGHERGGTAGLFVAGISFIFPAVIITGFLAWLYGEYGTMPEVEPFIAGIKPTVLAIIAGAIYKLGKKALKSVELGILGILVVAVTILGVNEILALLGAGILWMLYYQIKTGIKSDSEDKKVKKGFLPLILLKAPIVAGANVTTLKIFLSFLKVGAILYGSGYVLFAYLDAELVTTGWLSRQELIDAIAIGQFTPGPVLSTATFIGYQLGGFWGAAAASAGIFLPSFLFVLMLNPLIPKMRQSKVLSQFLNAVNIAAVAIMVSVLFEIGRESLVDWRAIVIAAVSFAVTFGMKKVSVMWVVLGGAILGYLLHLI
ncbi:MAG: chromate efflux transporter [Crocinitomicaceae bacterium]|nr:chromate efflux transporter [Crocinitomicaceae bacterium]MDG1657972.1 chromate efflux transporter [Crocinitomicaceae bacterium]|tara:strand:- start:2735 stop:3883 length:1149 start_codon:yes stop_codon:yes gene_type:complete